MLHPSYAELIQVINGDTEAGETPVVGSRYSVVLAAAKRARQITNGSKPLSMPAVDKPLSIAVDELRKGLVKIEPEGQEENLEVSEIAEEEDIFEDLQADETGE